MARQCNRILELFASAWVELSDRARDEAKADLIDMIVRAIDERINPKRFALVRAVRLSPTVRLVVHGGSGFLFLLIDRPDRDPLFHRLKAGEMAWAAMEDEVRHLSGRHGFPHKEARSFLAAFADADERRLLTHARIFADWLEEQGCLEEADRLRARLAYVRRDLTILKRAPCRFEEHLIPPDWRSDQAILPRNEPLRFGPDNALTLRHVAYSREAKAFQGVVVVRGYARGPGNFLAHFDVPVARELWDADHPSLPGLILDELTRGLAHAYENRRDALVGGRPAQASDAVPDVVESFIEETARAAYRFEFNEESEGDDAENANQGTQRRRTDRDGPQGRGGH